jgi:hypothetical protein
MASEDIPAKKRRRAPATRGTFFNHFSGRIDALTSAIFVFPLFATYQLGILLSPGQNGADFITRGLIELCARDLTNYLIVLGVMAVLYAAIILALRARDTFDPQAFVPVLAESTFYALTMGTLIVYVMREVIAVPPGLRLPVLSTGTGGPGPLEIIVISAGAGLHEELIFRIGGVGGLGWLLSGLTGAKRAWILALVISSVAFSLAHHIGPAGESFQFAAFTYRTLAGVVFALIYQVRGFAVAAWTHALYDVYVFGAS